MSASSTLQSLVWPRSRDVWGASLPNKRGSGLRGAASRWDLAARVVAAGVLSASIVMSAGADGDDTAAETSDANDANSLPRAIATPPTKEFMVAFYGGAPYTYPSTVNFDDGAANAFTLENVQWKGEPFTDPIYYGVRVVRWFEGGRSGSMLDFTHSKTIGEKPLNVDVKGLLNGVETNKTLRLDDVFDRLEFSHGHNMLTLNGLLRLADLHPRLSPYIGLGVGVNLPHTEIRLASKTDRRTYEYQLTGPVAQALIGIELRVPRMSYFFEYKFSFADYTVPHTGLDGTKIGLFADLYRQAQRWISGEAPKHGLLDTRLVSHQVIGGLGIRFGAGPGLTQAPAP